MIEIKLDRWGLFDIKGKLWEGILWDDFLQAKRMAKENNLIVKRVFLQTKDTTRINKSL
jgi:hypothetical protein